MDTVIISPWSKILPNKKQNAKNYPYWPQLVKKINELNLNVVQIGIAGEQKIDGANCMFDLKFKQLEELLYQSKTWISVDNFFQHFCNTIKPIKSGIVLWGKSDPSIFGYPYNINLLKHSSYLRKDQFDVWHNETHSTLVFVKPELVVNKLSTLLIDQLM
jgi:hypothetical protein